MQFEARLVCLADRDGEIVLFNEVHYCRVFGIIIIIILKRIAHINLNMTWLNVVHTNISQYYYTKSICIK